MTDVTVTGWYLENRTGSHNKQYTVLLAENGTLVCNWGPIGTKGQSQVNKFPTHDEAEPLGKRQLYSKQTRGYDLITGNFKFVVDTDVLNQAVQSKDARPVTQLFHTARHNPQYEGDKQAVLNHYDDVAKKAQRLLDTAGDRTFEEVFAEYEELKAAWQAVTDKHDEVATAMALTEQILGQRLMSGAL